MNRFRLFTALLAFTLAAQLFSVGASAKLVVGVSGVPEEKEPFVQLLSIPTKSVSDNRLTLGSFDKMEVLDMWTKMSKSQILEWHSDENGGYLRTDNIPYNYCGFRFAPSAEVEPGIYRFTGYFRTYNQGEVTSLRIEFVDEYSKAMETLVVNCTNDWQKVEYYVTLSKPLLHVNVCGAPYAEFFQDYCMDEFSLVKVDSIPDGANANKRFGEEVDRAKALELTYSSTGYSPSYNAEEYLAKYKVNGIMMNNDADGTLYNVGNNPDKATKKSLIDAAMQYKDSHVTDFMITVCNEIATYPSDVWMSYLDKYHQTEENGKAVDYKDTAPTKGAHYLWETLDTDYIALWTEAFQTIGINPWLSFRMNDIHDRYLSTSCLLSDFYHSNPGFRRVTNREHSNMGNAYDYTHKEVRDHYLEFIDEALTRYEVYGIELDFQREAFLWYIGGEYNGLDILNGFMRDLDAILKKHEIRCGHKLMLAVRVPSDPITNYDLGLDVPTWAAEGIIDHVTVTGRFEVSDIDLPIGLWKSILAPHGVTLAAGIDTAYVRHTMSNENAGWTPELYAGFCANAYSQGADKIYILNMNTSVTDIVAEADRYTVGFDSGASGINKPRWTFVSTMGSYEKVIEMNRRCTTTFNDTTAPWKNKSYTFPMLLSKGKVTTARIPVGDITVGSRVTLEFSVTDYMLSKLDQIKVFVNSEPCTYINTAPSRAGGSGVFTKDSVLRYEIPVEAQDEAEMLVEITYEGVGGGSIEHMEIYIEPRP